MPDVRLLRFTARLLMTDCQLNPIPKGSAISASFAREIASFLAKTVCKAHGFS